VDSLAKEGAVKGPPNQFTATPFNVCKKTHQEAFGTGASGHVGSLYWLLTVQNADEILCGW
jgi:hypothetical protein